MPIFDINTQAIGLSDYISRLEKKYKKITKINGEMKPVVLSDQGSNVFEDTPNGSSINSVKFDGQFTDKALNYSDNFELSMKRGINKSTDSVTGILMNDVDGKTIESEYNKVKGKYPKIVDNDTFRNQWETTPEINSMATSIVSKFSGNFTGKVTSTGKVDKAWLIKLQDLESMGQKPKPSYDVKQNRWWYLANGNNSATYLESVPTSNSSRNTLFIRNTSVDRVRTQQFPMVQQNMNGILQNLYETYDWGPNEYNDSNSPYQITHNEFGDKNYWGTIRNPNVDKRKYENDTVLKNIALTQANRLLEGGSSLLGGAIPISLNNLDTTGAGFQSTLLFIESSINGLGSGMGMVGSLAMNSISRNFGFPTKASYGMIRPSDSTLHNRYTIDGKGINQGVFNKTPFGIGETVRDLVNGRNTFETLSDNFNLELPGISGFGKDTQDNAFNIQSNMLGYYSVLSYSQIKILQTDNAFRDNSWIDFRNYITDGKAWNTPSKKDTPKLINSNINDIYNRGTLSTTDLKYDSSKNVISETEPTIRQMIDDRTQRISPTTRKNLPQTSITDTTGTIIDYKNFNPITKFGMSRAGAPGMYKKNFTRIQESLEHQMYDAFTFSPIEIVKNPTDINSYIKLDDKTKYRDYIKFHIYDVANQELIRLRATITDVAESVTPNWETSEYVGKADPVFTYKGAQRKFSFSFTMYSNTKVEFLPMWRKINKLYGLMYPTYQDDVMFDREGYVKGKNYISGSEDLTYEQSTIISKRYGRTQTEINKLVVAGSSSLDISTVEGYGDYTQSLSEMKKRNQQERKISYFMNRSRAIAPFIMFTLGDWFINEPGFLTELSVQVDNNYPWEINLENDLENIAQLPHLIRISTGFQPIGKDLFENGANFFGWNRLGTRMHNYQDPKFVGRVNNKAQAQSDDKLTDEQRLSIEQNRTEGVGITKTQDTVKAYGTK